MTGRLIALEGLSAVGKSAVAPLLAGRLGARVKPTVPVAYQPLRSGFRRTEDLEARHLFFASAVVHAATDIRLALDRGEHVVVDSYLARTNAFHRGMGSTACVYLPDLRAPDATFHLLAAPAERRRRLAARGRRDPWETRAEANAARILREYQQVPMHDIDTTNQPLPHVVDLIIGHRLDGTCDCANGKPLAGHPNLLSAVHP